MKQTEYNITTEVLVVGGGASGLVTALRAAEAGAQVLIAEKAEVGGGGTTPRSGHGLICIEEGDKAVEEYVEYHARNIGDYATNQDMVRLIASNMRDAIRYLIDRGVRISCEENGDIGLFPCPHGVPWAQVGVELNSLLSLRPKAINAGVKFQEHLQITGLLKDGDRIAGACGFDIYDGTFIVINAKAVVIATGPCGYKNTPMFSYCGEGNRLAYDAGAEMRSAEFGNFYENYAVVKGNTIYGGYPFTFNDKGENMWDKYVTWHAPDMTTEFYKGFVKEYREGTRMYIDMDAFLEAMMGDSDWKAMGQHLVDIGDEGTKIRFYEDRLKTNEIMERKMKEAGMEFGKKPEVKLTMHGNTGPIKVGLDFQTTVPGLFATGVANWNGCGAGGAVGQPGMQHGNGSGHAFFTGYLTGPKVAEYAKDVTVMPSIDKTQVEAIREETYSPIERTDGFDAHDMISEVQDCITPIKYNLIRSEAGLSEALGKLEKVRSEKLVHMKAKDWHDLKICNEVKGMAVSGEIMMIAAKARNETRGFHIREDYPYRDDKNWLRWTIVRKIDGKTVVSAEDIPIDIYKYRPDNKHESKLEVLPDQPQAPVAK